MDIFELSNTLLSDDDKNLLESITNYSYKRFSLHLLDKI